MSFILIVRKAISIRSQFCSLMPYSCTPQAKFPRSLVLSLIVIHMIKISAILVTCKNVSGMNQLMQEKENTPRIIAIIANNN